jgi:quinolinate synthase
MAAEEAVRRGTKYIVFCGVNFMAETADVLTDDRVTVILPHLAAACPMAAMADHDDVREAWRLMQRALAGNGRSRVIPIAYVNSSAEIKAFVGEHGGACCTSTNALDVFSWALTGGAEPAGRGEAIKVLFLPDEHLGRNSASRLGLSTEIDEAAGHGRSDTVVWNPKLAGGGLDEQQIRDATVVLWAGHCYVHTRFAVEDVRRIRQQHGDVPVNVIVHPECPKEVVDLSDGAGSTEQIIRWIDEAEPGTSWAVGTEVHLVNRLAARSEARGVKVRMLSDRNCMCAQMFRIDPQHLLWVLDNLAQGRVVNRVTVEPRVKAKARVAVERMIRFTGDESCVLNLRQPRAVRTATRTTRCARCAWHPACSLGLWPTAYPSDRTYYPTTPDRGQFPIVPSPSLCDRIATEMQSHAPATVYGELWPTRASRRSRHGVAIPLSRLVSGALALFEGTDLPRRERAVLAAVGLQRGETLRVRQGGDSCVIQVGTTRLALSGPAAQRILVRPLSPDHDG